MDVLNNTLQCHRPAKKYFLKIVLILITDFYVTFSADFKNENHLFLSRKVFFFTRACTFGKKKIQLKSRNFDFSFKFLELIN